jgi:polynucleotide 5'-kinase involved in rRNA processing
MSLQTGGFSGQRKIQRYFVGFTSPMGHMLRVLTGAAGLTEKAKLGADAIIYDTTGFINPEHGGAYLKLAKIELLRPKVVVAIQQQKEMNFLIKPLQKSDRAHVISLQASSATRQRDMETRQAYRISRFAQYFADSVLVDIFWPHYAIFPGPFFQVEQILAFEDSEGFAVGLGIIENVNINSKHLIIKTPLESLENVNAIRLGDLAVEPGSYTDRQMTITW